MGIKTVSRRRIIGNLIGVRAREAKSNAKLERYTVENCGLEARFIREKKSDFDFLKMRFLSGSFTVMKLIT